MEEQQDLKKQIFKHLIYNMIAFTVIFIIFGVSVFWMIKINTYKSANESLTKSKEQFLETDLEEIDLLVMPDYKKEIDRDDWVQNTIQKYEENVLVKRVLNPNVTVIVRDLDKNVLNSEDLGNLTDYVNEISFDEKLIDKIYEISVGENNYTYRVLNFIYENPNDSDSNRYIQLLINVDSEKAQIDNYFSIITIFAFIGIVLSIIASYILSLKTLNPIRESLNRQIEFVQNASHELRTPLTIIQAKQELLLQEPNKKIIDKSEDIILTLNETKRLTKLIKDLMMLSRADSNKIVLQKESANIDDFIKNLVIPYLEIAELDNKKIDLELNYNMDIQIDTSRIYQLMVILLDNAIKYTEEGDTILIKTELKDNKCVIEVADTGIGVSDEGLKRIFERFYREDKARSRETGGSGLGLSIANYIVTAHEGTIKATHNTPKGTIFTIRLPK